MINTRNARDVENKDMLNSLQTVRQGSKVNFIDRDSDVSENDGKDDSMREYCFKIIDSDDNENKDELITSNKYFEETRLGTLSGKSKRTQPDTKRLCFWEGLRHKHRFQTTISMKMDKSLSLTFIEPSVTTSTLEEQHVDNAFEAPSEEFIPRPGPSSASKRDTTGERVQPLKLKKKEEVWRPAMTQLTGDGEG
nr:unnamed protein product [Callosobruchus chinensis]